LPDWVTFLLHYSEHFIYAGLFLVLFLGGLGLPLPEEITLLSGGILVNLGIIRLYPTLAVLYAGAIMGDMALYSIGRKWGHGIITHRQLRKIFSESRLEWVREFFKKHGNKTVFIARFFTGFRVATFLVAGTLEMKSGSFLFFDALAALIIVPLLVCLGYYFGANIGWLSALFTEIDFLIKLGLVLAAAIAVSYYLFCRKSAP
jgi:membrane protein DedA with SNARE-associated domain